MFNRDEKNIIVMSLMYMKNDYTEDDLIDLRMECKGITLEKVCQNLIEDFVGPTWDEETTTENIKRETEKRSRQD